MFSYEEIYSSSCYEIISFFKCNKKYYVNEYQVNEYI